MTAVNPELNLTHVTLVDIEVPTEDGGQVSLGDEDGVLTIVNMTRKEARDILQLLDPIVSGVLSGNGVNVAKFHKGAITIVFTVEQFGIIYKNRGFFKVPSFSSERSSKQGKWHTILCATVHQRYRDVRAQYL